MDRATEGGEELRYVSFTTRGVRGIDDSPGACHCSKLSYLRLGAQ